MVRLRRARRLLRLDLQRRLVLLLVMVRLWTQPQEVEPPWQPPQSQSPLP